MSRAPNSTSRRAALVAAVLGCFLGAACAPDPPQRPATHWAIFIDLSGSIDSAQRIRYERVARRALRDLVAGDSAEVYALHDHTAQADPLLRAGSVPACYDCGPDGLLAAAASVQRLRAGLRTTLAQAFRSERKYPRSDVLGFIDRAHRLGGRLAAGRALRVIVLSDLLESMDPLFNLEAGLPNPERLGPVIERVAADRGWNSTTLKGVSVECFLPSGNSGGLNTAKRRRLEALFDLLIRSLGGELSNFDVL